MLKELFAEAQQEVLQEAWDRHLLKAFRTMTYPYTSAVVEDFRLIHGLTFDEFNKLKRIPRHQNQTLTRIPRFIAGYLPKLNNKLYDTDMTDDELVVWMNRIKLDSLMDPIDLLKVRREAMERYKSKMCLVVDSYVQEKISESNAAHGRKWSVVKAVRNK